MIHHKSAGTKSTWFRRILLHKNEKGEAFLRNLVKIDFDRCKECHYCVKFCPKKIIAAGDKINKQGYYTPVIENMEECIGCATCAKVCPEGAIEVVKDISE